MVNATTSEEYTVSAYSPEREDDVLELLEASLGAGPTGTREPALWRWKHMYNAFGESYAFLAISEDDHLAGLRAFMKWKFQLDDMTVDAVRAVDTSTHPDHQRKGIFKRLTLHALSEVEKNGVDLVFNTPNEKSMPGYLNMGWEYVGKVHPIIKVIKPISFATGFAMHRMGMKQDRPHEAGAFFKRPALSVAELLERADEVAWLLTSVSDLYGGKGRLITPRTVEYLRWRYASHPQIPYHATVVERNGKLQAAAIYRTNTRYGLREAVMCEMFLARPEDELCKELLKNMKKELNADYIICYFSEQSPVRKILNRQRFWEVPRMGMDFTVRPISHRLPVDARLLSNWSLSMGDLELF